MFRFIHCADIHLDSPMRGLRFEDSDAVETVRRATRRALENLVDLAIRESVDFVIIAGDVFDGDWEDYSTGLFFSRCMSRLDAASIPVYLIRGNHDAASVVTRHLALPENVTTLSEVAPQTAVIESLNVAIHGQSFAQRDVTENLVVHYPAARPGYFNIGILHTGLAGREGHANYAPCTVHDLLSQGYDYWALGHIHQPEVVNETPPIIYAGNIQGRHVRETGTRGCVLVRVEDGQVDYQWKSLDVVRWFEIECSIADIRQETEALQTVRDAVAACVSENAAIPLCLRIRLTDVDGEQEFIHRDKARFLHEVLNAVNWSTSQQLYVEKVVLEYARETQAQQHAPIGEDADGILQVLDNVAYRNSTKHALAEKLSEWQRAITTRMQSDDAPRDVTEEAVQHLVADATNELRAKIRVGGE